MSTQNESKDLNVKCETTPGKHGENTSKVRHRQ
jgi:hypothetical protein